MKMWRLGPGREPARYSSSAVGMVSCNGAWINWDASWSSLCQMDPLPSMSPLEGGPPPWCLRFCLSSKNPWHNCMSCRICIQHPWALCCSLVGHHTGIHTMAQQMDTWGLVLEVRAHTEKTKKWIGWPKVQTATFHVFVYPFLKAWLACYLFLLMHLLLRTSKMFLLI